MGSPLNRNRFGDGKGRGWDDTQGGKGRWKGDDDRRKGDSKGKGKGDKGKGKKGDKNKPQEPPVPKTFARSTMQTTESGLTFAQIMAAKNKKLEDERKQEQADKDRPPGSGGDGDGPPETDERPRADSGAWVAEDSGSEAADDKNVVAAPETWESDGDEQGQSAPTATTDNTSNAAAAPRGDAATVNRPKEEAARPKSKAWGGQAGDGGNKPANAWSG